MAKSRLPALTREQSEWLKCLEAWSTSGQTLATYARSKGLEPRQLYSWRTRLKSSGIAVPDARATAGRDRSGRKCVGASLKRRQAGLGTFVAARVTAEGLLPVDAGLRISFRNGIMHEIRGSEPRLPDVRYLTHLATLP